MNEQTTTEPITLEEREYRYKTVSSQIQELYAGKTTGYILRKVFTQYNLSNELYPIFATTVGDTILGFYEKTDLKKVLESELGISSNIALKITIDLEDLLSKIEDYSESSNQPQAGIEELVLNSSQVRINIQAQNSTIIPKPITPSASKEPVFGAKPLTREEVLQALSPKRTMSGDVASIQKKDASGWGSTQ